MDDEVPPPGVQSPAGRDIPFIPHSEVAEVVYRMTPEQRQEVLDVLDQAYRESQDGATPNRDLDDLRTTIRKVQRDGDVYPVGLTREESALMNSFLPSGTPLRGNLRAVRTVPSELNGGRRKRKTRGKKSRRRKTRRRGRM